MRSIEDNAFLLLIITVSLAFAWILWPFYGAILWGTIIAILFVPVQRRILSSTQLGRNLAAVLTILVIVVILILPMALVAASLTREAVGFYTSIESGEIDLALLFRQVFALLPQWVTDLLNRFGLVSLEALQGQITTGLIYGSQYIANQAIVIGQSTFQFMANIAVMLYLLFFLLRDEGLLYRRISYAIPLRLEQKQEFLKKFTVVIRATVKGDLLVALLQGALGGLIFWLLGIGAPLLWAVVMAVFSLLPAIGSGLVWGPVAIYLLATGAIGKGVILIAFGGLVIGLVDNFLRPILVGKDTKMPDYVVLISTLGGIATFGLNGFVIGPVIAAMFIAAWDIFSASRQRIEGNDGIR